MKKLLSLFVPLMALLTVSTQLRGQTEVIISESILQDFSKICYPLPANAVDLGTGVAWATTNYDASQTSKFATGDIVCNGTTSSSQNVWYYYNNVVPPTNWRIPTREECEMIIENDYEFLNTGTNSYIMKINSRISDDYITIGAVGYYYNSWQDVNLLYIWTTPSADALQGMYFEGSNFGFFDATNNVAVPARLVYDPTSITKHVITVHIGNYTQKLFCQEGQQITLVATPQEGHTFQQWGTDPTDTNPSKTIIVTEDAEYYATFHTGTPKCSLKAECRSSVHFSPAGYTTGWGMYEPGTSVTMSIPNVSSVVWNDNNTENPRTIIVTEDVVYTADVEIESGDKNEQISQEVAMSKKKILHTLHSTTVGDITYTPVDLGYGVAWADKNIGATDANPIGSYFRWGDPIAKESFSSGIDVSAFNPNDLLPPAQDAARQNMDNNWRMPTANEASDLIENTTITDNNKFSNKSDNSKYIILPASGYKGSNLKESDYQYYWTSQYWGMDDSGWSTDYVSWALTRTGNNTYRVSNLNRTGYFYNETYLGMPVRAIYQPQYVTRTLTIHVGIYSYAYVCQEGQRITITAMPADEYHFDKWQEDNNTNGTRTFVVTKDMSYTATFAEGAAPSTATVTWKNADGTTLETDENVAIGDTPSFDGATNPTKANDLVYSYTFAGWNDGTTTYGLSDDLPEVSGDVTYTAVYNSADLATFDLVDDIDAGGLYNGHDYYAAIATLATLKDQTRNVTYHRTMEEGKWHVVSLPFNFDLILNSSHPFANNIYELTDVTYSDGGYLNFEFTHMTTMMMANKPYVFYSTTEAKDVTFNGVTFAKLERYTGDGASIGITGGSVDFINTTSRIQLTNGDKRQIYIYNNKLYYPGSDAAYMRAFRGYFYLNNITIHHVTPRMRIVLDGQTATELEMTESAGTADEVRKYMENGVMVIERNGVKYNAQGGRME